MIDDFEICVLGFQLKLSIFESKGTEIKNLITSFEFELLFVS
jgi:hypothetical protein